MYGRTYTSLESEMWKSKVEFGDFFFTAHNALYYNFFLYLVSYPYFFGITYMVQVHYFILILMYAGGANTLL